MEYIHILYTALEGAKAAGAQTELVNLYDLEYKGCISCLACKVKNGKSLGRCAVNDGLKPVLSYEMVLKMYFKNAVSMRSTETLQIIDYSKYHMASFNESDRKKRREEVLTAYSLNSIVHIRTKSSFFRVVGRKMIYESNK